MIDFENVPDFAAFSFIGKYQYLHQHPMQWRKVLFSAKEKSYAVIHIRGGKWGFLISYFLFSQFFARY